jgi:hypothetical protein
MGMRLNVQKLEIIPVPLAFLLSSTWKGNFYGYFSGFSYVPKVQWHSGS